MSDMNVRELLSSHNCVVILDTNVYLIYIDSHLNLQILH